jgi:hypothetical protein
MKRSVSSPIFGQMRRYFAQNASRRVVSKVSFALQSHISSTACPCKGSGNEPTPMLNGIRIDIETGLSKVATGKQCMNSSAKLTHELHQ